MPWRGQRRSWTCVGRRGRPFWRAMTCGRSACRRWWSMWRVSGRSEGWFEPFADGRNRSRNYPAGLEAEPVEEAVPAHVGVRPDIHPFERQGQQDDITVIDKGSLSELVAVLHITHGGSASNLCQGAPRITKWQHLPPERSFRSRRLSAPRRCQRPSDSDCHQ